MKKSIKQIESLELGNFKKVYGDKIMGGGPCTTMTIKEVVIIGPKKPKSLENSLGDDQTNDGTDDCGPEPGH